MLSPKEIITAFFNQLSKGCESIQCNTENCKCSPNFSFHFNSASEIASKAIELAKTPYCKNLLCPGLNLFAYYSPNPLNSINERLRNLLTNSNKEKIQSLFEEILADPKVFPYLLLTKNDTNLTSEDFLIDEKDLKQLISLVNQNTEIFEKFRPSFENIFNFHIKNLTTLYTVRFLFLCFCFDPFLVTPEPSTFAFTFFKNLASLPIETDKLLSVLMTKFPSVLNNALLICQTLLSILSNELSRPLTSNIAYFVAFLHNASLNSDNPLPLSFFYNEPLTRRVEYMIDNESEDDDEDVIEPYISVLSLPLKSRYMYRQFAFEQHGYFQRYFELNVSRKNIVQDSIAYISNAPTKILHRKLSVNFVDEAGVDAGGPSREFFYLLINQVFSPDYGTFKYIDDKNTYWFVHNDFVEPITFNVLGTVIALAIYNCILLPIRFPIVLYKKLLKMEPSFNDLNELEPDIGNGIQHMRQMIKNGENIEDLCLDFTTNVQEFDQNIEKDLIPDGFKKKVTNENFEEYVKAMINFYCVKYIEKEFSAFERGFNKLTGSIPILSHMMPDELDILVSGLPVRNWEDFKSSTKYENGYTAESQEIKWFWKIFDEFSDSDKKTLLRFVTGSDRAPIAGLKSQSFVIQRTPDVKKLPVAHTCLNILILPQYTSEEVMRKMLKLSIANTEEGFGLL